MLIDGYVRSIITGDGVSHTSMGTIKCANLSLKAPSDLPSQITVEMRRQKMTNSETNRMSGFSGDLNRQLVKCEEGCKELANLCKELSSTKSLENVEGCELKKIVNMLSDLNKNILYVQLALRLLDSFGKKEQEMKDDSDDSSDDKDVLSSVFAKMLKVWTK